MPAPACPPMMTIPGRPRPEDIPLAPKVDSTVIDEPSILCYPQVLNGFGQPTWDGPINPPRPYGRHIDHNFKYVFSGVQNPEGADGTGASGISLTVQYPQGKKIGKPQNPQKHNDKKKNLAKTGAALDVPIIAVAVFVLMTGVLIVARRYAQQK
ncbi:hypothetical protein EJ419_03165 [Alloscardovia theropitheci]|uniref:LPXTG cell wall anchor domain-containing protein n=1 Tax=Alloscardovia theropitheci TaxID=2496842 RepID=A0A4V2MU02_9BIFI|nr:hypothetical protein [Alloscardovia theropitheci]TCD54489.1 hypothetical protein EJ419_03165 [Alloscardovia theropitheci]